MARKTKQQTKLEAIVHPTLLLLRKTKIGPIWPPREDVLSMSKGMRDVKRKKTASPFDDAYRKKRRRANKAARWSRNGRTLRYSPSRS